MRFIPKLTSGKIYDIAIVIGDISLGSYIGRILYPHFWGEPTWERPLFSANALSVFFIIAVAAYIIGLLIYFRILRQADRKSVSDGDHVANAFLSAMVGIALSIIISGFASPEAGWKQITIIIVTFFVGGGGWFALHYIALASVGKDARPANQNNALRSIECLLLMYPLIMILFAPVNLAAEGMALARDSSPQTGFIGISMAVVLRSALMAVWAWIIVYLPRKIAGIPLRSQFSGWKFFAGMFLGYAFKLIRDFYFGTTPTH